jgi:hypothetical protein
MSTNNEDSKKEALFQKTVEEEHRRVIIEKYKT